MIICDTNIWYDLGSGKITDASVSGKELACTQLTLNELISTPNLLTQDYAKVQNAVVAIKRYAKTVFWANPFEFAINRLMPSYCPDLSDGMILWQTIRTFPTRSITIPADKIMDVKNLFNVGNKDFEAYILAFNEFASQIKLIVKQNTVKNVRRQEGTTSRTKEFLTRHLNEYPATDSDEAKRVLVNSNMATWCQLELLFEVLSDFFKDIELNSTQKIHTNDWGDILNLAYVGTGDFYWTGEKKWVTIAQNNRAAAKYLFQP